MRELFRYSKAQRTRSYGVRHVAEDSAELWVVAFERGRPPRSRRLATLTGEDETTMFLETVKQELRLGGWSPAAGI